ncbi:hypothetical protein SO802_006073 [Lithocarpus litseifolius]|uniref:Uncharacterized protein n=1 Tax=Lithocarpus litseifolius TaxID=425828 RepID=A0AAW2DJW8_9ROSI
MTGEETEGDLSKLIYDLPEYFMMTWKELMGMTSTVGSNDTRDCKDDSNSNRESNNNEDYNSQYSDDDWGAPLSDREDDDEGPFYEDHFNDGVDYYDEDIEDDAESKPINIDSGVESEEYGLENMLEVAGKEVEESINIDYDDYPFGRPSNWSYITNGSSRSDPCYDKHGRENLELGSFHNSELGSLTPYTGEEDDIHARLATLD